ncbi:DNA polymerase Y family protein [Vibrio sp. SCSIO 43135]|nr:DNA polymerase Y family protein [Vibrio sp. SCSIO 43135]USD41990.1 DNA polymerase Y family protein [Vibrio sp. SCSIO 43135]
MQLWLYLHFPTLQLDALFAQQNEQPLAIVEGKKHQIVQCNSAAQEQGIKAGLGLGSAAALCADLQVHPYDARIEQQTLTDIAQWLYLITSDIALFPPQGILLKVTDMLSLYQGLDNYWHTLSQHLNTLALNYSYSTGFSPFSAILLAKSHINSITLDKETILNNIQQHPIASTELDKKQLEQLSRVGIQTLQELLELPLQELARRFNIDLVNYVGRLTGRFKHPITLYHPPEAFHSYMELLFDIENVQWLEKPLGKLLKKLELFLTLRNQVAYELELTLHQRDKVEQSITFTSAIGDYSAAQWTRLCQLSMESLTLEGPVQGLTLTIKRYGEQQAYADDIFEGKKGQQSELELVSLLQAKLGKKQVRKVCMTPDPRPDKATRLYDPAQTVILPELKNRLRPSIMLPEPELLCEKVSLMQGPERVVTGWWDGDDMTRDYFIARSQEGRWLWIFRNQDKQWFLHGQFS